MKGRLDASERSSDALECFITWRFLGNKHEVNVY
jgi:hypothetical protein